MHYDLFEIVIRELCDERELELYDDQGRTLLWHACYYNDVHAARGLLQMGGSGMIVNRDQIHNLMPLDLANMHADGLLRSVIDVFVDQTMLDGNGLANK